MMKAYSLLSAVALLFICAGCGVHRTAVSEKTETASERQTVADYRYLSERLGIDVTSKDEQHLALYKEAAGWLGTPYRYGGPLSRDVIVRGWSCKFINRYIS